MDLFSNQKADHIRFRAMMESGKLVDELADIVQTQVIAHKARSSIQNRAEISLYHQTEENSYPVWREAIQVETGLAQTPSSDSAYCLEDSHNLHSGGLRFPDIDQVTDLLLHRSIITHGPLLPLLAFTFASTTLALAARWFAIGVSLSFAVHLAFDLFPRAWLGYALISVPFYGWTPATFSWAWIAVSALLCTYLAFRLIRGFWDTTMLLFSLICVFAYAAISENPLWRPIAAMTIFTIAAGTLSVLTTRPHSSPDPY